jgi:hypothetical protein
VEDAGYTSGDVKPAKTSQINICRRVNGSGTQTSANRFWLEYPQNATSLLPATNGANSEFSNNINNAVNAGTIFVYEGSSTSNVRSCLEKANDNNAFAIGHVSLENTPTTKWKFVSVDGAVPSRDNAKKGFYHYLFESTMQTRNAAAAAGSVGAGTVPTADQYAFLNAFITASQSPNALANLAPANQNGVAAIPTAADCAAADFGSYAGGSNAEKFCSRVRRLNAADPITVVR